MKWTEAFAGLLAGVAVGAVATAIGNAYWSSREDASAFEAKSGPDPIPTVPAVIPRATARAPDVPAKAEPRPTRQAMVPPIKRVIPVTPPLPAGIEPPTPAAATDAPKPMQAKVVEAEPAPATQPRIALVQPVPTAALPVLVTLPTPAVRPSPMPQPVRASAEPTLVLQPARATRPAVNLTKVASASTSATDATRVAPLPTGPGSGDLRLTTVTQSAPKTPGTAVASAIMAMPPPQPSAVTGPQPKAGAESSQRIYCADRSALGGRVLPLRAGPSPSAPSRKLIAGGDCSLQATGRANRHVDAYGRTAIWLEVSYQGEPLWASAHYLSQLR